jgi:hypothetical protein
MGAPHCWKATGPGIEQFDMTKLTASSEVFELKVLVEADDWHDVAALIASVDRALDPHQRTGRGDRRWSVIANRLPAPRARELLGFVGRHDRLARASLEHPASDTG